MKLQTISPQRKQGSPGKTLACAAGCYVRAGLTLLEVIISLAIFLFSMVALLHLMSLSGDRAMEGSFQTEGTLRCRSKLAEVMNGAVPFSSTGWTEFPEAPDWKWELDCQAGEHANLYNVQVGVQRKKADGTMFEVRLSQMMIAPSQRGSTLVSPANTTPGTTPGTTSGGN
jgi:hypothetical protein